MKKMMPFIMAAALLVVTAAVSAYPNLNATTGVVGTPNAHVVPAGSLVGAGDVVLVDDAFVNARVLFGITNRFEGGAGVVLGDDTGFIVNGKYQFAAPIAGFTTALGATYVTADEAGTGWQVYLVGTRPLWSNDGVPQIYGSLGVNFTDLESVSAVRPFVNAQWRIGNASEIGGEFMFESGDFGESISSLYLRHTFSPTLAGQVGFTNANGFVGQDDHDLFLGLSYTFAP